MLVQVVFLTLGAFCVLLVAVCVVAWLSSSLSPTQILRPFAKRSSQGKSEMEALIAMREGQTIG